MHVIEVKNLSFVYPEGNCGIKNINLYVDRGEFIGILGANGAGKTTLLKQINRLLKPTQGEVLFEGNNIRNIDKEEFFSKVCMVFQNPDDQLFAPTVALDIAFGPTNMGLSKDEVDNRVHNALELVGMIEFAQRPIHTLSLGEKKRICIAGVLAMEPDVILLDEPTSSLDPMCVSSIMHLLKKLNKEQGKTLIMATHSVDLVPLFIDRVFIMSKGGIIRSGKPEVVFAESNMVREAKLRLPRIAHLIEILRKHDNLKVERLPLTIGEARRELVKMIPTEEVEKWKG
jgi:cobalt/nickel transport system ATP-binding protein